jgi:hypothetical protein
MAAPVDDLVVALEDALDQKQDSAALQSQKAAADVTLDGLASQLTTIEQSLRSLEGESGLSGFRTPVQAAFDAKIGSTDVQTRVIAEDSTLETLESNMNAVEVGIRELEQALLDHMTQVA